MIVCADGESAQGCAVEEKGEQAWMVRLHPQIPFFILLKILIYGELRKVALRVMFE
jgi:hypothetical protein